MNRISTGESKMSEMKNTLNKIRSRLNSTEKNDKWTWKQGNKNDHTGKRGLWGKMYREFSDWWDILKMPGTFVTAVPEGKGGKQKKYLEK